MPDICSLYLNRSGDMLYYVSHWSLGFLVSQMRLWACRWRVERFMQIVFAVSASALCVPVIFHMSTVNEADSLNKAGPGNKAANSARIAKQSHWESATCRLDLQNLPSESTIFPSILQLCLTSRISMEHGKSIYVQQFNVFCLSMWGLNWKPYISLTPSYLHYDTPEFSVLGTDLLQEVPPDEVLAFCSTIAVLRLLLSFVQSAPNSTFSCACLSW